MVRFGSVRFRGYFARTLNQNIGSDQQFPWTLNWTLGSGSKGSVQVRGGSECWTERWTLFWVMSDYIIKKIAHSFCAWYHKRLTLVVKHWNAVDYISSYVQVPTMIKKNGTIPHCPSHCHCPWMSPLYAVPPACLLTQVHSDKHSWATGDPQRHLGVTYSIVHSQWCHHCWRHAQREWLNPGSQGSLGQSVSVWGI